MEALSRAFCDFHHSRATMEDPNIKDDKTKNEAMRKGDDAIRIIIATPSPVSWRVSSKLALLEWLMSDEGGGVACPERFALRMIGSIKADLEHLGIGEGQ